MGVGGDGFQLRTDMSLVKDLDVSPADAPVLRSFFHT